MISAVMKPASNRRIALALCCVLFAGAGYRVLVAAMQEPAPVPAFGGLHRDGGRTPPARTAAHPAPAAHAAVPASAAAPRSASAATAAATPQEKLAALRAPVSVEAAHDPFTASSWLPPPPVVVPPLPETRPAPPSAPPVPFTYVGEQDAKAVKPHVFLSNGDQLLIVSPGDVIDGQYRVESVSESNVVLTYLPLNQVQVVSIPREK
ncbi:hypothetical protein [Burkholderia catarinensis]|uniref:hypothetical protein n=1 Tax=Burkholderia catarinensis TaxID=1108140 RepID=UPI001C57BDCB|nr:hypothetical protein [Burkholderia catarinensis]KAG8151559.1 hypothetical protein BFF94_020320 [Burkholderia catarinensis]